MSVSRTQTKHAAFIGVPFWVRVWRDFAVGVHDAQGHIRGLLCFSANLLRLDHSLVITFFTHATWEKQADTLAKETGLSPEQFSRLHIITVGSATPTDPMQPFMEVPQAVLSQFLEPLMKGEAVAGYAALPPPTVLVADFFAHSVIDYARETGFKTHNFIFVVCEPGGVHMKTRSVLGKEEVLEVEGHPPQYKSEFVLSSGPFPPEMVDPMEVAGFQSFISGHSLLLFWSRRLAPKSAIAFNADTKAKGGVCIVTDPQYHPSFWEPAPSRFPDSDPVFAFLNKQTRDSVLFISFGSAFFPIHNLWQIDTLLDSLIAANVPFILNLNSDTAKFMTGGKKAEWEKRTEESGNIVTGWIDQPLTLKHPALGWVLTHGGANTTLESLVNGLPLIFWPFAADQHQNAGLCVHELDVGFELLEIMDKQVGKKLFNFPGYSVKCTPDSVRKEFDELWPKCASPDGQRKRMNAHKASEVLRREHAENGDAYAREFLALI